MTIPEHLLRGAAANGNTTPVPAEGGFTFAIGNHKFRYDRLGLRREGWAGQFAETGSGCFRSRNMSPRVRGNLT